MPKEKGNSIANGEATSGQSMVDVSNERMLNMEIDPIPQRRTRYVLLLNDGQLLECCFRLPSLLIFMFGGNTF